MTMTGHKFATRPASGNFSYEDKVCALEDTFSANRTK